MSILADIYGMVLEGRRHEIAALVNRALGQGIAPGSIVEDALRPAMNEVGERFSRAEAFLPDLILASEATKSAIAVLRPLLSGEGRSSGAETTVIGTVEGDVHDIGKNLVIATLEGAGHNVIDVGIDVPAARFVEAVRDHDPAVVGLSALLSTTMIEIPRVIEALEEAGLREGRLIAVGGAPVTQRNADEWGAEIYAGDAGTAARIVAERLAAR
jgi:5-methyltetrahydrofolate--homocysteine methyltransferase